MKERGGTLTVALDTVMVGEDVSSAPSADLEPGPHVRITVRDTGTGMSREVQERLFEPFFTTKGQAGTGLGLAVVHGIIRDHGGAITVHSEVGVGTQFEIYLPAGEGPVARRISVPEIIRGTGQHVMYVDDEASLALVMSRTLRQLGYRCTEFSDAAAALQEFRTTPSAFDAVITDFQMPRMSGLDLVRAVRAIRPGIPVAVASGYAAGKSQDPDAQSVAWIQKPATLTELGTAIHRILGGAPVGPAT
jgi:CheY-like chemotaxis protein